MNESRMNARVVYLFNFFNRNLLAIKRNGRSLILGVVTDCSLILMSISFLSSKSVAARAAPCRTALVSDIPLHHSLTDLHFGHS